MLKNDLRYIIKRVIVAVLIAFILFFLKSNKILAATCPSTTNTYDARYTTDYTASSSSTNVVFNGWGSFVGTVNMGTAIARPSAVNPLGFPSVLSMLSIKYYNSSSFIAGNTYNFVLRVNTSSSDVARYYQQYSSIAYVRGADTTASLTDSTIQTYTLDRIKIDDDDSKIFYIYYSITPNTNVKYIWTYIALIDLSHRYNEVSQVNSGNVVVRHNSCTFSEGSNSYIQQNTNAIIDQTKKFVSVVGSQTTIISEQTEYLKDDTDASVDVSGMSGITGILPAGPLDSLLSLPITILNIFIDSTAGSCSPMTFNFVFDEQFTIPCFDIWNHVPTGLMLFLSDLPAVLIFIKWAKSVYKRVERATMFESSVDDEWGGI